MITGLQNSQKVENQASRTTWTASKALARNINITREQTLDKIHGPPKKKKNIYDKTRRYIDDDESSVQEIADASGAQETINLVSRLYAQFGTLEDAWRVKTPARERHCIMRATHEMSIRGKEAPANWSDQ